MAVVQLHCPLCTGLFQVDDSMSGAAVNCPHCQGMVTLPSFQQQTPQQQLPPASAPALHQQPSGLNLNCPACSRMFQIMPEMAGMQVGCPHCATPIVIPDLASLLPPGISAPQPQQPPRQSSPSGPSSAPSSRSQPAPSNRPLPAPRSQTSDAMYPPGFAPPGKSAPKPTETPAPQKPAAGMNRPVPAPSAPTQERKPASSRPIPVTKPTPEPTPSPAPDTSMLPPSAGADLLPPGADLGLPPAIDSLLPPGAGYDAGNLAAQPLPTSLPGGPTDDATMPVELKKLAVHEPAAKTIRHRGVEVELRTLTPEEKAKRKFVKNLVVGGVMVIMLVIVMVLLSLR